MKLEIVAAAIAMGVIALLPGTAAAATGTFSWSPDGNATRSLNDPRSGACYTLEGSKPPFYAVNNTNRTVHYYRSPGCVGEVGTLSPKMSGNITQYVKFD